MRKSGLPDLNTIIETKVIGGTASPELENLLAAAINVEKPVGSSELNYATHQAKAYSKDEGIYENFISKNFLSPWETEDYLTATSPFPTDTRSVPIDVYTRLGLKLSELDIDHVK